MPTVRTWIWIIVGIIGVCLLALVGFAGATVYYVSQRVQVSDRTSKASSQKAFDTARATFKDQRPLFEMDTTGRPRDTRRLTDLPTSKVKPTDMVVMVWDQEKERLVHVSMPFWLLKLGRRKIDLTSGNRGFDLDSLNVDVAQLERVGPILVLDFRSPSGERVLIWTQ